MNGPSIVLAREWDAEMATRAEELQPDRDPVHMDPVFEWTGDDYAEFELERRIAAMERRVPTWAELFGFEGGFRCGTFQNL